MLSRSFFPNFDQGPFLKFDGKKPCKLNHQSDFLGFYYHETLQTLMKNSKFTFIIWN